MWNRLGSLTSIGSRPSNLAQEASTPVGEGRSHIGILGSHIGAGSPPSNLAALNLVAADASEGRIVSRSTQNLFFAVNLLNVVWFASWYYMRDWGRIEIRPNLVLVSGIATLVTLFSANEDFVSRTLGAVPGLVARMVYFAGLRNNAGEYEHWGLAHTHGALAAQKAVGKAHTDVFLEVLRIPLARLAADYECLRASARNQGEAARIFRDKTDELVPNDLRGGGRKHFSLVVDVLCSLEQPCRRNE